MPYPQKGESKDEYISRCIPYMIKKEGKEQDQAVAMCHAYWKEYRVDEVTDHYIGDIENAIRDDLVRTKRRATPEIMYKVLKLYFSGLSKALFMKAWDGLVKDKYLIKTGSYYQWEAIDDNTIIKRINMILEAIK